MSNIAEMTDEELDAWNRKLQGEAAGLREALAQLTAKESVDEADIDLSDSSQILGRVRQATVDRAGVDRVKRLQASNREALDQVTWQLADRQDRRNLRAVYEDAQGMKKELLAVAALMDEHLARCQQLGKQSPIGGVALRGESIRQAYAHVEQFMGVKSK